MIKLSVMYPRTDDLKFDMDYYRDSHLPMMRSLIGDRVKGFALDIGMVSPNVPSPYAVVLALSFESLEAMQAALAEHGPTLASDIPKYTNVQPVIQVSETAF